jgi:hypothetical protein
MSSGRLIQRPLSDGEELKRAEKLKKAGQSTEGRLDPGKHGRRQYGFKVFKFPSTPLIGTKESTESYYDIDQRNSRTEPSGGR